MTAVALESPEESRKTAFVGMVMGLASWAMLFASLFFAYAMVRLRAPGWPPEGTAPLPRLLPGFNTLILLASSVALHLGVRRTGANRPGALVPTLWLTIGLGSAFLLLQTALWAALWRSGFQISSGPYGSVFYGLTVFHAVHVLAGLAALAWLLPGAKRGDYTSKQQTAVRLPALFWHFVDVVWVVMYVAVYLV